MHADAGGVAVDDEGLVPEQTCHAKQIAYETTNCHNKNNCSHDNPARMRDTAAYQAPPESIASTCSHMTDDASSVAGTSNMPRKKLYAKA